MQGEKRVLRKILIVICLIVFCGSGYYVFRYVFDNISAEKTLEQIAESKERGLEEVYAKNDDLVGWVEIEDTKIDYPVMQTAGGSGERDPEFYLHRDFNKESSESGTPFLDSYSSIAGATKVLNEKSGRTHIAGESTWNWLIYGHHMKFGTMFHDLMEFEDKSFWEEHRTFCFDRIDIGRDGSVSEINEEYEIIAAAYSKIYPDASKAFKYYTYAGDYDEESFDEFLSGIKAEACYDTGISASYGDQLVTLSTCAYHTDNGRFYVVGKRIE